MSGLCTKLIRVVFKHWTACVDWGSSYFVRKGKYMDVV